MAVKFDPAAYQQSVNDYLAAMGVNVAPTEEIYQTPMAPQGPGVGDLAKLLGKEGLKYGVKEGAKKGISSVLGSGGTSAAASAAAPPGMTAVGTAANGATMYAPTASIGGAAGSGAAGAGASAGSGLTGGVGTGGVLAGAYTGKLQYEGLKDVSQGNKMGLKEQVALALPTFGTSFLYNPAKKLWDKDEWRGEQNRRQKLAEAGIAGWDQLNANTQRIGAGRSIAELINPNYAKDFQGMTKDAGFVNNKFAASRNEGDLRPEDIWGYSAFGEKFGNDWLGKFSEAQRKGIAQAALDAGAVKEGKGTVNIDFNADLDKRIQEFLKPKAPVTKKK